MWSTPIVALAVLAIAYASPIPTLPGSLVSETTLSTTEKVKEALPTTSGDLHSLPTVSTTKKHFTFKPFTFKPRTIKPFTKHTIKPTTEHTIKPITDHAPITVEGPLKVSAGLETTLPSTTSGSSVQPARHVRSAAFDGPGWQLAETPSTVHVSELPTLSTLPAKEFTSTFAIEHSSPITIKPLDLTTLKDDKTTTSVFTLPTTTAFPIPTASLLPIRHVRAAAFEGLGWQEADTTVAVPVNNMPGDDETKLNRMPEGPGWQISESGSTIGLTDSTTTDFSSTPFTTVFADDFSTSTFGDFETTSSTFAPITSESLIRNKRLAGFNVGWNENGEMQAVNLNDLPAGMPAGPGWQMEESSSTIEVPEHDEETTIGSTELPTSIAFGNSFDGQPGWQVAETGSTIDINDDTTTSAFDDLSSSTIAFDDMSTSTPAFGNSFDGQPGWQISETGSTIDLHDDTTTSAFADLSSTSTLIPAFGNSNDETWQMEGDAMVEGVSHDLTADGWDNSKHVADEQTTILPKIKSNGWN